MKKKILTLAIALLLMLPGFKLVAQTNLGAKADATNTIMVKQGAVVPKNQTYYLYDEAGTKLLATFSAGQSVNILQYRKAKVATKDAPKINCAQVNCPPSFGSNVICWKCM